MIAAERVAATVAQGVHGRRRVGLGDSFWQFRPFVDGDVAGRIDWRQSAKSGRPAPLGWYVRETEWEAAQTVFLWRDGSSSMRWQSRLAATEKRERAELLLLALASLLLRGGERVALLGEQARPVSGRAGLDRIATALVTEGAGDEAGLPAKSILPRHSKVVLFGDFLGSLAEIQETVSRLSGNLVTGYLMQVLDPAEMLLPYEGRVRFKGLEQEPDTLIPRVETVRDEYGRRLAAQQDGLATICRAARFGFGVHRTDHPPETALLGLYTALSPR